MIKLIALMMLVGIGAFADDVTDIKIAELKRSNIILLEKLADANDRAEKYKKLYKKYKGLYKGDTATLTHSSNNVSESDKSSSIAKEKRHFEISIDLQQKVVNKYKRSKGVLWRNFKRSARKKVAKMSIKKTSGSKKIGQKYLRVVRKLEEAKKKLMYLKKELRSM